MKTRTIVFPLLISLCCWCAPAPSMAASITTLFSTGLASDSSPLVPGTPDPHYTVTTAPSGNAPTPFAPSVVAIAAWRADDSSSAWMGIQSNYTTFTQDPAGLYTFRTHFDLSGMDPSAASISFRVLCDNALSDVLLNGVSHLPNPISCDFFTWLGPFTNSSGFVRGLNQLDFVVNNYPPAGGNACGLRVEILDAHAAALTTLSIRTSQVEMCWNTDSSLWYQLQYTSALTTDLWTPLNAVWVRGTGATYCTNDTIAPDQSGRFYRVISTNSAPP